MEVVVANRGPRVKGVTVSGSSVKVDADPDSLTYLIHGGRTTWEGNFGFNDNHVEFNTDYTWSGMDPKPTYLTTAGSRQIDIPFFDEPDDAEGSSAFLGVFTTAGDAAKDFTAIWD